MLRSAVLFLLIGMVAVSCGDDPPPAREGSGQVISTMPGEVTSTPPNGNFRTFWNPDLCRALSTEQVEAAAGVALDPVRTEDTGGFETQCTWMVSGTQSDYFQIMEYSVVPGWKETPTYQYEVIKADAPDIEFAEVPLLGGAAFTYRQPPRGPSGNLHTRFLWFRHGERAGFVVVTGNSGTEPLMKVDELQELAQAYLDAS